MTPTVHDADKLRELDDGEREAWRAYSTHLRDLAGPAYELAETDSWAELQRELRQLERRRKALIGNAA